MGVRAASKEAALVEFLNFVCINTLSTSTALGLLKYADDC